MNGSTMHHHYHILYDLRTILGNEKKIYTEIGTYCGGSASLILQHDFQTEINCIDPLHVLPEQEETLYKNMEKFNKNKNKYNIHKKFSTDHTFLKYLHNTNFTTDILFIDGDHTKKGATFDFENYKDFVNPGGFIVFDDYEDYEFSPEVRVAVDEIVSRIDTNKFNIIGTFKKIKNVYDGCSSRKLEYYNEYIIQKV
jgi:predicted O-methyltransferase YrrM